MIFFFLRKRINNPFHIQYAKITENTMYLGDIMRDQNCLIVLRYGIKTNKLYEFCFEIIHAQ